MQRAKFGTCSVCNTDESLLYRRNPPMCQRCNNEYKMNKKKSQGKKVKKSISPFSEKRLERYAEYRVVRDKYLADHPICEVHDCNNPTTNLHHKAGRNGRLLTISKYFMACCDDCHPKRIHENPAWAREHGYIVTVNLK